MAVQKTTRKEHLDASQQELKTWHSVLQRLVKEGFDCDFTLESLGLARDFWYANSSRSKVLPWYSWLVQLSSANVSVNDDAYELVALTTIKAGTQLSVGANLDNSQLLLRHGLVLSENLKDEIQLKLPTPQRTISLSRLGIPGQVVDQIEEEQNTQLFVSILKSTLEQRRSVKESLKILPQALNFTVCKGALQRRRKQYLETFLEGQLAILQATLEQMQDAEEQAEDAHDEVHGEEAEGEEAEENGDEEVHREGATRFAQIEQNIKTMTEDYTRGTTEVRSQMRQIHQKLWMSLSHIPVTHPPKTTGTTCVAMADSPVALSSESSMAARTESSWREWSQRENGEDGYKFGDFSRGLLHQMKAGVRDLKHKAADAALTLKDSNISTGY
eukprot:s224_g13.t1